MEIMELFTLEIYIFTWVPGHEHLSFTMLVSTIQSNEVSKRGGKDNVITAKL